MLRAANRGLPAATSIFKATEPLFEVVYPASRELGPIFSYFNAFGTDTVSSFAKAGAATAATHEGRHYLRTLLPITSENLVGATHRSPTNRFNPYLHPGGLGDFPSGGLRAFGCANTSNPIDPAAARQRPRLPRGRPVDVPGQHARVPARRARRPLSLLQ